MHIPTLFYYSVLNFVVFAAALYVVLRKPTRDFFAARAELLAQRVADAGRAEADAKQRIDAIRTRMNALEGELVALRRQAEADAEAERLAIIQRAETFSSKIVADTERMIGQELGRAEETLKRTAVDVAIMMAERILREQMTPDDQGRVAMRFVDRIGTKH